jgi:hypothetical protein
VPFAKCMDTSRQNLRVTGAPRRRFHPGLRGESGAAEDEVRDT